MTRTKPVTPDEVRVSRLNQILTLPMDALDADWGLLPGLLDPLMAELHRRHAARQAALSPELWALLAAVQVIEFTPLADLRFGPRVQGYWDVTACRQCGREHLFQYLGGPIGASLCSDACVRRHKQANWTEHNRVRSRDRELERQNTCDECGEVMEAQRSTKRYCSTRCRVAAFRRA